MNRYQRRVQLLAAGLSGLAGFVDAIGFISLGGFFVSFMSGNTTRLGVGVALDIRAAAVAVALIALFVAGVVLGTLTRRRPGNRAARVLALVAGLLAVAALCGQAGFVPGAAMAMAMAMGAENTVFEHEGEVHIGLTYMTGTLVRLGQRLTAALTGGEKRTWRPYLLLWLGLAGGGVMGALAWPLAGWNTLWAAAGAAALFAVAARRIGPFMR